MSWNAIVAGIDASLESAQGAALGWRIARAAGVPYHLMHAARDLTNDVLLAPSPDIVADLQSRWRDLALDDLMRIHAGSVPPEALARLQVRSGRAAVVLARAVDEYGAGLVVLGGKHHSALDRWLHGSTAHAAVRRLDVPVLVAAGAPSEKWRILVALDSSDTAPALLAAARELARGFGGVVRALHVIEPFPIIADAPILIDVERRTEERREQLQRDLQPLLEGDGDLLLRSGAPATEIAKAADAWQADLVVVGTHAGGWLDQLVLGSVTKALLAAPPTSLLVVPHRLASRRTAAVAVAGRDTLAWA